MKLSVLRSTSKEYKRDVLERYADLFNGGECFRERIRRYLPQNEWEPRDAYERRVEQAHYLNYCKPIGLYLSALLFSRPLTFDNVPAFYTDEWAKDVDGKGTPLDTFLRDCFVSTLLYRTCWIRVSMPSAAVEPRNLAEFEEQGLDEAQLEALDAVTVIDWRRDRRGNLLWLKTRVVTCERLEPYDATNTVTETFTIYRPSESRVERFEIAYREDTPPADTVEVPALPVETDTSASLVEMTLPEVLHLMEHLSSPALEHFRARNALAHQIRANCYEMPWMQLKDPEKPPVMGAGYYGILSIDENIFYPEHGAVPYEVAAEYGRVLKDELHRVTNTMSLGVENNAATIGRSGESKAQDNSQTENVLEAFAKVVRRVAGELFKAVGLGRNEKLTPTIGGMTGYSLPDAKNTADAAVSLKTLGIRSVTAMVEIMMRAIQAFIPDLPADTMAKIRKELEANTTAEDLAAQDNAMNGNGGSGDPNQDPAQDNAPAQD
jgi:hypothetical protein